MVRDWHRSVSQVFDRASATTRQSNVRRLPIFPIGTMILTRCGGFIRYRTGRLSGLWRSLRPLRLGAGQQCSRRRDKGRPGGEIIMGRQVTEIRLDTATGARPASSMPAGAAKSRRRLGRRSSSPMPLATVIAATRCRRWRASGSGRTMLAGACRSHCSRQPSACRCARDPRLPQLFDDVSAATMDEIPVRPSPQR